MSHKFNLLPCSLVCSDICIVMYRPLYLCTELFFISGINYKFFFIYSVITKGTAIVIKRGNTRYTTVANKTLTDQNFEIETNFQSYKY